ncbi:MAG TPA: efflux RND transporter periplasmic adaptor subunit [Bacteroidia bacterium]
MENDIDKNSDIKEKEQLLFETRSEDAQEIIGKMPSWIIRWGIAVISIIVLAVLMVSGFVKSPDIGSYPVVILRSNPDTIVKSMLDGRIKELFVKNGSHVSKGDPIVLMDNEANFYDVLKAKQMAQKIDTSMSYHGKINIEDDLSLGELKYEFQSFLVSLKLFQEAEFTPSQSYQIHENIRTTARRFVQMCDDWEKKYLIRSVGDGKVVFLKDMSSNTYVRNKEDLFVVKNTNEETDLSIIGVIQNEMKFALKEGQEINLKLLDYPFQEFGVIKGKIVKISGKLPNGKCYVYIHTVNNKLRTTKGYDFNDYNSLSASGEFVLRDETILQKLLNRI